MLIDDTILISFDATDGRNSAVLIIGRKNPKQTFDIINSFHGVEAIELYKKLVTKKEKVT